MFPVDYRYGWDLGCREHQQLLLEVGHTVGEPRVNEQGAQGREAHNRLHQEGHLEEKRRRPQVPAGTAVVFSIMGASTRSTC